MFYIVLDNPMNSIKILSPAYFALVMATGIVSIASHLLGFIAIAHILLYINALQYILLIVLYFVRFFRFREAFLADFNNTAANPGFLTFVAGTCVLGNQYLILVRDPGFPQFLLIIGLISWVFLIYASFLIITIKRNKLPIEKAISGVWLIFVVSTQSVAILIANLSYILPIPLEISLFISLFFFLCGCMLYIIVITLIVHRLSFFDVEAEQFAPPYWINMGAVAISTLAGATLILFAEKWVFLQSILPFLKGFTLFFWAIGTWWIPLIIFLGVWRHLVRHLPFRYHPQYWGMVFPLGMYTVCTFQLAKALDIEFLKIIPSMFIYISLLAWLVVFVSMVFSVIKNSQNLTVQPSVDKLKKN